MDFSVLIIPKNEVGSLRFVKGCEIKLLIFLRECGDEDYLLLFSTVCFDFFGDLFFFIRTVAGRISSRGSLGSVEL